MLDGLTHAEQGDAIGVTARWLVPVALAACAVAGCRGGSHGAGDRRVLRLATSYSLDDSGLFAAIDRAVVEHLDLQVRPSFVGTGEALALGRAGKADCVLVHSREQEDEFVAQGFGVNRREVWYSEFIIVGPPSDPLGLRGTTSVVTALARIAAQKAPFVSRGDKSGNHVRERSLWGLAGVEPKPPWYEEARAGMLDTLLKAEQRHAYVLVDRPTYVVNRKRLTSEVLVEGDTRLYNPYAVIAVNPLKVAGVDYDAAMRFVGFLVGPTAQAVVRDFGRREHGQALFEPLAGGPRHDGR